MRNALLVLLGLLCATSSGCLSTIAGPRAPEPVAFARAAEADASALTVEESLNITIEPQGTGYGRLEILAANDVTLLVSVDHPMLSKEEYSPRGGLLDAYDEFNHTLIYVYLRSELPRTSASFFFEWIGYPVYSRPSMSSWREEYALDVPMGTRAVVLVATTIPDYRITIRTPGATQPSDVIPLPLGPVAGYVKAVPSASERTRVDLPLARVERERIWKVDPIRVDRTTLLLAQTWTVAGGDAVNAGWSQDEFQVTGSPRLATPPFPDVAPGGAQGRAQFISHYVDEPTAVEGYRRYVQTQIGTSDIDRAGFSIILVPLA